MLTIIRNGQKAELSQVVFTYSDDYSVINHKGTSSSLFSVLNILRREGFIRGFSYKSLTNRTNKKINSLTIYLKYDSKGKQVINNIFPISTQSRRIFLSTKSLWQPQSTAGLYILSTPRGLLTDSEARRLNVGGEILFGII